MSAQTTLTEDAPMILDATCSFRHIWPKHATIRIDIRPEVKPDFVMDNTDLKFPDAYFDEIYWDPPHMFRRSDDLMSIKNKRRRRGRLFPDPFTAYGYWHNREEWLSNVRGVNEEFARCLKPNGRLYIKLADSKNGVHLEEVLAGLTNFDLEINRTTKTKSNLGKSIVHWLTMKPKEAPA